MIKLKIALVIAGCSLENLPFWVTNQVTVIGQQVVKQVFPGQ